MFTKRFAGVCLMVLLGVVMVGCQKPDMSDAFAAPQRPAALDHLGMLVGTWEGEATIKICGLDEPMTGKGTSTSTWDADKWMLVERYEYEAGEDEMIKGTSIYTWDPKIKKFRLFGTNNWGELMSGTGSYCPKSKTWYFEGETCHLYGGGKTYGKGYSKMINEKTQEWKWKEWTRFLYFFKTDIFEGEGTVHRK